MDLALFNSYELDTVRARMLATAKAHPKTPWAQAYRAASVAGLIALRTDRTIGVWGDQHWLEKYSTLRKAIAATEPATLADAASVVTRLLQERLELDRTDLS